MSVQTYSPDEFDTEYTGAPAGAHRRPMKRWQALLPVVVVLIVCPLLAWGTVYFLQGSSSTDSTTASQSTKTSATDTSSKDSSKNTESKDSTKSSSDTADKKATESVTTPEPKAEPKPEEKPVEINKGIAIEVVNIGTRTGYARQIGGQIQNNGFTNVTPRNIRAGEQGSNNVIYYGADEDKATAEEVAKAVPGVSVVKGQNAAGTLIIYIS